MNITFRKDYNVQNKSVMRVSGMAGDIFFYIKLSLLLSATVVVITSAYV